MSLNIKLVRDSFEAIRPHALDVVDHFYGVLFTKHPAARGLFENVDMEKQKKSLANALAHCVEYLEEEDHLVDYLKKMGARHIRYGAEPEHYDWVGESLIETFRYFFADNWTPEAEQTWTALYGFIAKTMKSGANSAPNRTTVSNSNMSLHSFARIQARKLFEKALQDELNSSLQNLVQKKAQDLLRKAIQKETEKEIAMLSDDQNAA